MQPPLLPHALVLSLSLLLPTGCTSPPTQPPPQTLVGHAGDLPISIKMISPVTQTADLQILCILQHNPAGDQYLEAMADLNNKLLNWPLPQTRV